MPQKDVIDPPGQNPQSLKDLHCGEKKPQAGPRCSLSAPLPRLQGHTCFHKGLSERVQEEIDHFPKMLTMNRIQLISPAVSFPDFQGSPWQEGGEEGACSHPAASEFEGSQYLASEKDHVQ